MVDQATQITVISKGLDYWLEQGAEVLGRYGQRGANLAEEIRDRIGDYDKIGDVSALASRFKDCLAATALALWQMDGESGLAEYNRIMDEALPRGYIGAYGNVRGTRVEGFLRYVVDRDLILGYKAGGNKLSDTEFIYWIADPFSGLVRHMPEAAYEILSTHGYVATKMHFFFADDAPNWRVELKESPWRDNNRSLWKIRRLERQGNLLEAAQAELVEAAA